MESSSQRPVRLLPILVCFFLSGAAGLVYQVAWGKALGLVYGHTVYAIATVLAVFMAGLASGSAWLGRWSARHLRPVALYGWVELGVAATGALSLVGLGAVRTLYVAVYHSLGDSAVALLTLRFTGAALVLFLPTFLMGGTLPILVRGLTRSPADLGVRVSRLYWVNTLGAVAGTLAAGFWLLPLVGLRLTVATAVALNVLAGLNALLIARRGKLASPSIPETRPTTVSPPGRTPLQPAPFLLACFAMVGATAMAYEIGWTRLLATMLGSSTYAFTLMLATFLAGIVLGSIMFEHWSARGRTVGLGTFAATQTLTGLAALGVLVFFQRLPSVIPPLLRATHETFAGLVLAQFVTSALAMLPAAAVFGFNFPVVTVLIAGSVGAGRDHAAAVGRAYAANTLGAIGGAILTGFWLVPKLGSFRVVALAAGANFFLAALLQLRAQAAWRRGLIVAAANLALAVAIGAVTRSEAFYSRAVTSFSIVLYWDFYESTLTVPEIAATTDIVFAEDGLNASISVARTEDYLALRTNGKVDASTGDTNTQLIVGHLGAIFHPAPRRVLIIGFGSGMTVSAVARYPEVERIDCVEIEPAVIHAAPHLERLNRGVLRDPRLRIILDDARNFLLTTRERYDLIISEPSNPWIAGVATLFTREYYRGARARLNPGGVFLQWVQAYSLYPEDLRMILATFLPAFAQVTLWQGDAPDLLLLAQTDPTPLRLGRLRHLWPHAALRADYERLGLRQPEGLLAFYLLDDADLRRVASAPQLNTDDRTYLEYQAPRALLAKRLEDKNRAMLEGYRTALLPRDFIGEDLQPETTLAAIAEALLNLEEYDRAARLLDILADKPPTPLSTLLRGRLELHRANLEAATRAFTAALRLDPASLDAAQGLAEAARRSADLGTAELLARQVLARDAKHLAALETMASIASGRSDWKEAAAWQRRLLATRTAPPAGDYVQLADFLSRAGDPAGTERALLSALEQEPYSYRAHRKLGELYWERTLWEAARAHLEFVVVYFPDNDPSVYKLLAEVHRAAADPGAAEDILRKGRRIFPDAVEFRQLAPTN